MRPWSPLPPSWHPPNLTDGDVEALKASLSLQEQLQLQGDSRTLSRMTREFHFVLYRRSGRERLCTKIESLWDGCRRYQRAYLDLPGGSHRTIEGHHEIVQACESRDSATLEAAIRNHILSIAAGVETALAERGLRPPDALSPEEPGQLSSADWLMGVTSS